MQNQNYPAYSSASDLFVDEPMVYAGFWDRFGAAFIDCLILIIPDFLLRLVFGELSFLFVLILGWLYYALQESGVKQATVGKKTVGIKVTNTAGERISFGQASGRFFGKYISAIILCIGYLMMLWDDRRQTLHDKMADTLVVKS